MKQFMTPGGRCSSKGTVARKKLAWEREGDQVTQVIRLSGDDGVHTLSASCLHGTSSVSIFSQNVPGVQSTPLRAL